MGGTWVGKIQSVFRFTVLVGMHVINIQCIIPGLVAAVYWEDMSAAVGPAADCRSKSKTLAFAQRHMYVWISVSARPDVRSHSSRLMADVSGLAGMSGARSGSGWLGPVGSWLDGSWSGSGVTSGMVAGMVILSGHFHAMYSCWSAGPAWRWQKLRTSSVRLYQ